MPAIMDEVVTEMFFGLIADEETTTGFLLAALGQSNPETGFRNFYIVNEKTTYRKLRDYFIKLYSRKNIAILLLSSEVAGRLESFLQKANKVLPIILTIPTKDTIPPRDETETTRQSLADVVAR